MSPLFTPGPVDVAPEVLAVQARPILPGDSKEFQEIYSRVIDKTRPLFQAQGRVFLGSHSGTGMQEMAVRNLVNQDMLCCINGGYSERWWEVAVGNNKNAERMEVEWGLPILPEQLKTALTQKHYEAVSIVHNESSTGVENALKDLSAVIHEVSPETLILVDAVSSLGGVRIDMDTWGIDFLFTASQHCLALPPGLSVCAVSERAMQKVETVQNRGWYFDLLRMEKSRLKETLFTTPPIPLVYALDLQMDRILTEGLENRFARHAAMANRVQTWAQESGMPCFAPADYRSKSVVTIKNAFAWKISELNKYLWLRGMRIANGYEKLKDATFRIATMGETQMNDIENLLRTLESYMTK